MSNISLIGKTIKDVAVYGPHDTDDADTLRITFTDETVYDVVSYYGAYTGNSLDEYPCGIFVKHTDNFDYIEKKKEEQP